MQIIVRYGLEQITKTLSDDTTVGNIKQDPNLRAALGFGDNVRALINGVEVPNDAQVPYNATVVLETACNTKAILVLN